MKKFVILVNTTDSFEDCWNPFFTLFEKYFFDYKGKIYLNTETKEFTFKNLNIISLKNNLINDTWGNSLKYALNKIEENEILYLQEDYFLNNYVNTDFLHHYFNVFSENRFDCLHLTDQCTPGPFLKNTRINNVWHIEKGAKYRLSTQAAFWKKESLLRLIRPWENGWQFERFGSMRSNLLTKNIMIVNINTSDKKKEEIIPYVFTGIIKGRWNDEVVALFKANSISVDYKQRGFYSDKKTKKNILKVIKIRISNLKSLIDILKLSFKIKFSNNSN